MSLMGSEGSLGAERIGSPRSEIGEVADSVPVFPYACAIQYRRVRGRTLLPGSEWDSWVVYNVCYMIVHPQPERHISTVSEAIAGLLPENAMPYIRVFPRRPWV